MPRCAKRRRKKKQQVEEKDLWGIDFDPSIPPMSFSTIFHGYQRIQTVARSEPQPYVQQEQTPAQTQPSFGMGSAFRYRTPDGGYITVLDEDT